MRYVIYGAGAIGATIGARLHLVEREVTLIARGAHLERLQADGLVFREPSGSRQLSIPTVGSPAEVTWHDDTVVVLAMKSQDTVAAVAQLAATAPGNVAVVCAQNGIANERNVLRCMPVVYGAHVVVSADHLEPGVVARFGVPFVGLVDIGRFPGGENADDGTGDVVGEGIAGDLTAGGFRSAVDHQIMAAKARKLHYNLGNAVSALIGPGDVGQTLTGLAREEADAVFAAAGIAMTSPEADRARREGLTSAPADGVARVGGSTMQSLLRGAGAIETDYLNGEIVVLGRIHGVPTPVNEVLQRQAAIAAHQRLQPAAMDPAELMALVERRRDEVVR